MKYLVVEDFVGQPIPFLFPDRVDHADMRDQLPYGRVLGAGYVVLKDGEFVCSGGSTELGAMARAEDGSVIKESLQHLPAAE